MTEIDYANVLRCIVIALCLYGVIATLITLIVFRRRWKLESENWIKRMPDRIARHLNFVILWGLSMAAYTTVDMYTHFNSPFHWQSFFFAYASTLYAIGIYHITGYELGMWRVRRAQVKEALARALAERTDEPNPKKS